MGNMLSDADRFLTSQMRKHAATEVVYARGDDSVTVMATVGRTQREIEDASGSVHRWDARDYLITASDLRLGGLVVEPQEGDRIIEKGEGRSTVIHEVRAAFSGQAPWSWSDSSRTTVRVHTAYLGIEDA
ncbi:MAG: hypothetical protein PSV22_00175 [Pseudolabrys sp.]|nr:hypothetical protein [Pseudolabrys sp.]